MQQLRRLKDHVLVLILHRDEDLARRWQLNPGAKLAFQEGPRETLVDAHHFAGRPHLRAKESIDAREAGERQHRFLHRDVVGAGGREREGGQFFPGHQAGCNGGDGRADRFRHEGHGAGGAGVHLKHEDIVALDRELHVHQPDDAEREGHLAGLALQLLNHLRRKRMRGQRTGAVAGMNARLLDMLHHARDMNVRPVAKGVDVDLYRARKITVDQHRAVAGDDHRVPDVTLQLIVGPDNLHRPAAEDIGRADDDRIADLMGNFERLFGGMGDAVMGLFEVQFLEKLLEPLPVLRKVDGVGGRAEDWNACRLQRVRQLQRSLAAELDDDAVQVAPFLLHPQNLQDAFDGQRLEIEAVGSVVVCRHRLRVAVDHDGFVPGVRQRETGVTAAIVELDPLADPVRAAAEDDDFLAVGRARLAFDMAHRVGFVG